MTQPQTEAKGADAKAAAMDAVGEAWMANMDSALGVAAQLQGDAGAPQPDFVPCERTVRMCIEAASSVWAEATDTEWDSGFERARGMIISAVERLLPKPDRAEELADKWMVRSEWEDLGVRMAVVEYTRDLIAQGEIK